MDLISSIEQRLKAPQTVFGNGLVSIVEQPTVAGLLWNSNLGANARWHKKKDQHCESVNETAMRLQKGCSRSIILNFEHTSENRHEPTEGGSSVTLTTAPVSDEGVYIYAVNHSRIDHTPVVV